MNDALAPVGGKTLEVLKQQNEHYDPEHHFAGAHKMVAIDDGDEWAVDDFDLARFANEVRGAR